MLRALILQIIQLLAAKSLTVVQLQADIVAKVTELAEKVATIAALELSLATAMSEKAASATEVQTQTDRALLAETAAADASALAQTFQATSESLTVQLASSEASLAAANEAEAAEDLGDAELASLLEAALTSNQPVA